MQEDHSVSACWMKGSQVRRSFSTACYMQVELLSGNSSALNGRAHAWQCQALPTAEVFTPQLKWVQPRHPCGCLCSRGQGPCHAEPAHARAASHPHSVPRQRMGGGGCGHGSRPGVTAEQSAAEGGGRGRQRGLVTPPGLERHSLRRLHHAGFLTSSFNP